jgi:hypothetical protein
VVEEAADADEAARVVPGEELATLQQVRIDGVGLIRTQHRLQAPRRGAQLTRAEIAGRLGDPAVDASDVGRVERLRGRAVLLDRADRALGDLDVSAAHLSHRERLAELGQVVAEGTGDPEVGCWIGDTKRPEERLRLGTGSRAGDQPRTAIDLTNELEVERLLRSDSRALPVDELT